MDEKLAYSVEEAAQALSLGRTTVKKLIAAGQLTSVRVGRRRLIPRSTLETYINSLVEGQASA
ncbi:excisionase [Nocardiopsis sp. TSRI0078]|uniref:excisionase family DNA-binding protein n=1 Tax=unclassified Nocardiopsis TaxID=2649073 RepID=UPI00093D081C|nr:helix-turn-helix domain-containing protein [Nocardiopsis sp. TSRI0078]OKI20235.1 excisionase [Nocardiopsis sp. TSRI0078]